MNSTVKIFMLNFIAAVSSLLAIKIFLAYHVVTSGEVGVISPWNVAAKFPLLIGSDIAGAFIIAFFAALISHPFAAAGKAIPMLISCAFQIAHAFFACLSFHLLLILGGMIDRALIDLTFFNQDAGEPFTGVLSDSISIYITPGRVAMTASCVALPLALLFLLRRFDFRYSRRARALFVSVSLLLISITWFLVPGLSSGRLIGTRILSYGLERSALAEFIYSYARPVMESFIEPEYELGDDFRFSHGIEPPDGASEKPPVFEGASPLKTNVVLVVMESISAEYLEKDTDGKMPFLRSLLSSGVYLQRHYAHWGQTMKSLFSILCSEYPYPGHRPETDINLAIPCVSLIERLHSAGYYTSIFQSGDSNFDRMKSFFKARGVDEYYDMSNMPGSENCWRNSWGIDEKVTVDAILEWAQDFGKGGKGERFFIMYILSAGHHPYTYPGMENIRVESDRDAYDGTLSYVDGRLKTLVNGLAGKGMTEKTLLVIISDHGEGFGRHLGGTGHGPVIYDEHVRVPAIFIGPQIRNGGHIEKTPTGHIDLAPTILGLLGIDTPATMKGVNLAASPPSGVVFMGGRSPNRPLGVVAGKWKYIFNQDTTIEELYNFESDPLEKENLIDGFPEMASDFKGAALKWKYHTKNLIENYSAIKNRSGTDSANK